MRHSKVEEAQDQTAHRTTTETYRQPPNFIKSALHHGGGMASWFKRLHNGDCGVLKLIAEGCLLNKGCLGLFESG